MIHAKSMRREGTKVCDGHRDETMWTLRSRQTGKLIVTMSGHSYLFSDESDAVEFARESPNGADLEVIPVTSPAV
jgi:hypothetical protein